ncbi:hypothetical protein M408DRAFT_73853, partial [Serendipita vermifera MAFF 305830]
LVYLNSQIVVSNQDDDIIATLKPADFDYGSHVPGCMEGTRRDILTKIDNWVNDLKASNILWIKGYPGVGKSAISTTLVEKGRSAKYIISSFFFRREQANVMTTSALWRTVAHDLACHHPIIRKHLVTALVKNNALPATSNIDELFYQLIYLPLTSTEEMQEPVLVVVDALDECGGLENWHSAHRRGLMRTLKAWSNLPSRFKLVVTSRAEHDIEELFSTTIHQPLEIFAGQKVNSESTEDIRAFIKHELVQIVARYSSLPSGWPGEETIDKLTEQTAGLFIWIKTFLALLKRGEPQRTLRQLLSRNTGGITSLYAWVLRTSFPDPSTEDIEDFQSVLGAIIFVKYPLGITSLTSLLAMDSTSMEYIYKGLYSVLDCNDTVRIHHQSFVDFLVNPKECPEPFHIDRERANRRLTEACLRMMRQNLRFNICDLKSSYVRNNEVPNLEARAKGCIPTDLSYVSCCWADHLVETGFENKTHVAVEYFMDHQFLFWLETLSLLKRVNIGSSMLRSLVSWLRKTGQSDALAVDMQKFISAFASVISQSVPHIYLSALPFAPRNLHVSSKYIALYPQTLAIRHGELMNWPAIQNVFSGHSVAVNSVSFSRDGRHIVSGSNDRTIRVWDAETGATVTGPLEGHTGSVNSVSFSPDGRRIVSGSWDKTIFVWDAETGETLAGPLIGHTDRVNFVSFSPDGRRIVSGSYDNTVRVWDAETGEMVTGRMKGHTNWVNSVAFSPDGTRIVSGSSDKTIRVWNAETGKTMVGPMEGHTHQVNSVCFSPDGKSIVSGSGDMTIRVWDAKTGEMMIGPMKGHTEWVNSVAFSLDGTHIVSGSGDCTIRVWDVETGETIKGPMEGHTHWVKSVSFSPDGRRIVSGSSDHTIRVWDVDTSEEATVTLGGHTNWVNSVSFSPDGRSIVSGSGDMTIRVWDVKTGKMMTGPMKGHVDSVSSVAFSPDGTRVVSGSIDRTIRVWDAETGETMVGPMEGHTDRVSSVAFSPDGRQVVSGSYDTTVRIWNAETGETVAGPLKGHTDWVKSVSFSPDGVRIVSGSGDHTIRVWDAKTGEAVIKPLEGHTKSVFSVSFSPDGRRVVSGSYDTTIRIWNLETGETMIGPLKGHVETVCSVSFSPDGRSIVSGSYDKTILVWDAETGEMVTRHLEGHTGPVMSASFSPNGRELVSGSHDQTVRVWDVEMRETVHALSVFQERPWADDGWILGPNSELLFWVPPELRPKLCPLRNKLVLGGHATHLDLKHFVHGDAWTHCKDRSA